MQERRTAGNTRSSSLATACAGCGDRVDLRLAHRVVEGPAGTRGPITYLDDDIVVWDCPGCRFTNADEAGG